MPITWQNVGTANQGASVAASRSATDNITQGLNTLSNTARDVYATQKQGNVDNYKNDLLTMAMNPDVDEKTLMGQALSLGKSAGVDPAKTLELTQQAIGTRNNAASLTGEQQHQVGVLQSAVEMQQQEAQSKIDKELSRFDATTNYSEGSGLLDSWIEGSNPLQIINEAIATTMTSKTSTGYSGWGPKGGKALQDWADGFLQDNADDPEAARALATVLQGRNPVDHWIDDDLGFYEGDLEKEVARVSKQYAEEKINKGKRDEYLLKLQQQHIYSPNSPLAKSISALNKYQSETPKNNIRTVFTAQ